jgi:hypothetical protein
MVSMMPSSAMPTRRARGHTAVYDVQKCIANLMAKGMTEDEANEFFEFNTEGTWVGDGTPVFLRRIP